MHVQPQLTRVARRAADIEVIVIVAVHVPPCEARSTLREGRGQERLHRVVVEGPLHARARVEPAFERDLAEQRPVRCILWRCWLGSRVLVMSVVGDVRRLVHRVQLARREAQHRTRAPARPANVQLVDALRVPEPEVQQRLVGRHVAARRRQLPHLDAVGSLELDDRAQPARVALSAAQLDQDAVAGARAVAKDRGPRAHVVDDHVEVTVSVEVRQHGAHAHALGVEPPGRGDVLEVQVAFVAEREVGLVPHAQLAVQLPLLLRTRDRIGQVLAGLALADLAQPARQVRVEGVVGRTVRHEQIHAPVVVEVAELHRPGPVRARETDQCSRLLEARRPGVEVEGVAHVLPRLRALQEPARVVHVPHHQLAHEVGRRRHVRGQQIHEPVTVDVREVSAHREPGRVRQRLGHHVAEPTSALVVIELVRVPEVVGDIEVGQPVVVVVPPRRREPRVVARDARLLTDLGEPGRAVVAEEPVALARLDHELLQLAVDQPLLDPERLVLRGVHDHAPVRMRRARNVEQRPRVHAVGHQEQVQVAIDVVVREPGHDARPGERQPGRRRPLHEGPVALVHVQPVGRRVVADVEIEVPVAVGVGEDSPRAPGRLKAQARGLGHILEHEVPGLPVEPVRPGLEREVEIGAAIAVVVADAYAAACEAVPVEVLVGPLPVEVVLEDDPRARTRELLEERLPAGDGSCERHRLEGPTLGRVHLEAGRRAPEQRHRDERQAAPPPELERASCGERAGAGSARCGCRRPSHGPP